MSNTLPTKEDLLKKAMFVPCQTKEDLGRWVKIYLGIELPDCIVDPESNSTPLSALWEIYDAVRSKATKPYSQILVYSAREGMKTLIASILEVLMIVHLEWDCAHMAAIVPQAKKSQQYVKKFFNRPFLRDFISSKNERSVEFTRYKNGVGEIISPTEFKNLDDVNKNQYQEIANYINIVVCTVTGANSEHVPFMCVDEVDVVENPDAYEEAKFIPSPRNGVPPVTLLTSTRKYSFGKVQDEINKAHKTKLQIRHWNIIDVTEACPPERHLPQEPKIPIYVNDEELEAVSESEFNLFDPEKQQNFVKLEGYAGCLKNCSLFAACKGRLATLQKSKSAMLKPIDHVTAQFMKSPLDKAKAQLMCWKPSSEGLIFGAFDRNKHSLTAAEMAKKITGEDFPPTFSKHQLIDLMKQHGCEFYAGLDHGYSHYFAVVTAAVFGANAFVIDVIAQSELELSDKIEQLNRVHRLYEPVIYPDPEDPGSNKTLSRHFHIRNFVKAKGSVVGGIEIVRMKLKPTFKKEPELYFLKDDPQVEFLCHQMTEYHWKLDAAGKPTDQPEKKDDDTVDALRYFVMNVFSPRGRPVVAPEEQKPKELTKEETQNQVQNMWGKQIMAEAFGGQAPDKHSDTPDKPQGGSKQFFWDLG